MTFYDNHDMPRHEATAEASSTRTTGCSPRAASRSCTTAPKSAFMRGREEHQGNRNYFGSDSIAHARTRSARRWPRSRACAAIRRRCSGACR